MFYIYIYFKLTLLAHPAHLVIIPNTFAESQMAKQSSSLCKHTQHRSFAFPLLTLNSWLWVRLSLFSILSRCVTHLNNRLGSNVGLCEQEVVVGFRLYAFICL